MAWQTPKTDWDDSSLQQTSDMNRIEGNIKFLAGTGSEQQLGTDDDVQHADMTVDSLASGGAVSGTTGTFSGAVSSGGALTGTSINTGDGAFEIGQDLIPTSNVIFNDLQMTRGGIVSGISVSAATLLAYFDADGEIRLASGAVEWGHTGPTQPNKFYQIGAVKRVSSGSAALLITMTFSETGYGTDVYIVDTPTSESWYEVAAYTNLNIVIGQKI